MKLLLSHTLLAWTVEEYASRPGGLATFGSETDRNSLQSEMFHFCS